MMALVIMFLINNQLQTVDSPHDNQELATKYRINTTYMFAIFSQ